MKLDNIENSRHVVTKHTDYGWEVFDFSGIGSMEKANNFAVSLAVDNPRAAVSVSVCYRQIYSNDATHLSFP